MLSLGDSLPTCDGNEQASRLVSFSFSIDFTVQKYALSGLVTNHPKAPPSDTDSIGAF